MSKIYTLLLLISSTFSVIAQTQPKQAPNHDLGFEDTPILPGLPFHVHDPKRPHPRVVTPAAEPGGAPSDAIVLFDGKNLSKWKSTLLPGTQNASVSASTEADWKVQNGHFEADPKTPANATKEKFGGITFHPGMGA